MIFSFFYQIDYFVSKRLKNWDIPSCTFPSLLHVSSIVNIWRHLNMFYTMFEHHLDKHQCSNPSLPRDACAVNLGVVTECSSHQTTAFSSAVNQEQTHTNPSSSRNEPFLLCQYYRNLAQPSSSTCDEPAVRSTSTTAEKRTFLQP